MQQRRRNVSLLELEQILTELKKILPIPKSLSLDIDNFHKILHIVTDPNPFQIILIIIV